MPSRVRKDLPPGPAAPPASAEDPLDPRQDGAGPRRPPRTLGGFRGEHAFLSNFHPCPVAYLGRTYRCSEAAYMAQKGADPGDRDRFADLDGPSAKRLASTLPLRGDWETVRIAHMRGVLAAKFTQNPDLGLRLRATGGLELVEFNTWGDRFWGVCDGAGLNWLGRFLMDLRTLLGRGRPVAPPQGAPASAAARDRFALRARAALAWAKQESATELWLLRRLLAAAHRNPEFDPAREEAELHLLRERLQTWSRPMNQPHATVTVTTDPARRAWQATAHRRSPEGDAFETRELSGTVPVVQVLRPGPDGRDHLEEAPLADAELLGLALEAALALARDWEGPCILQADTRQNGMLKVGLHDWVKEGRLSEGESGFPHARGAWCRVLDALRQDPPLLRIRWTR